MWMWRCAPNTTSKLLKGEFHILNTALVLANETTVAVV